MTLDIERFRAIESVRTFLMHCLKSELKGNDKIISREKAYRFLKHFPEEYWMKSLEELYFDIKLKKDVMELDRLSFPNQVVTDPDLKCGEKNTTNGLEFTCDLVRGHKSLHHEGHYWLWGKKGP